MIRLLFSGTLPVAPTPAQLSAFLSDSRARNRRHDVCGAMVLMGRDFLQVIEGPALVVEQMYEQLSQNSRRYGLVLVARQSIARPLFGQWQLGLIQPPPPGLDPSVEALPNLQLIEQMQGQNEDERYTLTVIREFIHGKWHRNQIDPNQPVVVRRQQPTL